MATVSVYRALLIVRACWLLIGWFFGWGLSEHSRSFASIHPYAALFGQAFGVAFGLTILAGLWFFRRWARLLFVVLLVVAVLYGAFQVHEPRVMPPVFLAPVIWLVLMIDGAIIAISFLPPVRNMYVNQT